MTLTVRTSKLLDDIKAIATDIEHENYHYGPREDKCRLIRALCDAVQQEVLNNG